MVSCKKPKQVELQGLIHKGDSFLVEECRDFLAKTHKLFLLKKTYSDAFPEIQNINTPSFWNSMLKNNGKQRKSPMEGERIESALRILASKKGNLLDIGFGNGILERKIVRRKMNFNLYGIDISDYAVGVIKGKVRGKFVVGSATNIPFKDSFFHVVVALELLEHISPRHTFLVLSEIYRVLKAGGTFVVSVPLNENLELMMLHGENPSGHVRIYSPDLIKTELKMAGFKIKNEVLLYAFKSFYRIKKFLQKTILKGRWNANNIILVAQKS